MYLRFYTFEKFVEFKSKFVFNIFSSLENVYNLMVDISFSDVCMFLKIATLILTINHFFTNPAFFNKYTCPLPRLVQKWFKITYLVVNDFSADRENFELSIGA